MTLRLAKSKSHSGKVCLGHTFKSRMIWWGNKGQRWRKLHFNLAVMSRMPVLLLTKFMRPFKWCTVVLFAWKTVTLDLLSWLGDHGGQYPSLWWLFSHNHVCFWRNHCCPRKSASKLIRNVKYLGANTQPGLSLENTSEGQPQTM